VQIVRPPSSSAPLQRSVAACLASILEVDVADVPVPDEAHPEPWTVWSNWLAQRGVGLVPVAEPSSFDWPGPWLAVLRTDGGVGQVGAVAFGAPPGVAWNPLGGAETFDAIEEGYLIAPLDVALWSAGSRSAPASGGVVEAVLIAPEAEAPMAQVERATARTGRGLEGDRYFDEAGTFSNRYGRGHDLTLVAAELLGDFSPEEARRNIVTRGIDLDTLIGTRFKIGDVECFGQRRCEPCAHLERLAKPGILRSLIHKGGLRADVLSDGEIAAGSAVVPG
jgi:hypothetical protein